MERVADKRAEHRAKDQAQPNHRVLIQKPIARRLVGSRQSFAISGHPPHQLNVRFGSRATDLRPGIMSALSPRADI
jgi:hypothetical protein